MDFYDTLTQNPRTGEWLDKDGYPITERPAPISFNPRTFPYKNKQEIDHVVTDRITSSQAPPIIMDDIMTETIYAPTKNLNLIPAGVDGMVNCSSGYMERDTGSQVQLITSANTRVQFPNGTRNTFNANIFTVSGNFQTFTNVSSQNLYLLISASIRGIWTGANGSFGMWIARSAGTVRFAQTVLSPITAANSNEAHSALTCLQLVPGEAFSVFMSCTPNINIGHATDNFRKCSITIRQLP